MHRVARWSMLVPVVLVALMTGCSTLSNQPASPTDNQAEVVLSLPTRTLSPIVSFTPRFTATPIPSITPTPSNTPEATATSVPPTLTSTPTPTVTPTVAGMIRSTENVNLREGPGTNYDIVRSVSPGTKLGVIGAQVDASGREWYKVAYTDDDGEVEYLWVYSSLVDSDFAEVVSPSTATPGAQSTPAPSSAATPDVQRVNILAYCRQKDVKPASPTTDDNVYVEWSWYVSRAEYMTDHLDSAHYQVRLDGKLLDDWQAYATDMRQESGVWIVYWYYPVGKLSAGEHTITFSLTWDKALTDGYQQFGPGTAHESDTGDCTFTVLQP